MKETQGMTQGKTQGTRLDKSFMKEKRMNELMTQNEVT